eukprot:TRINITY_DN12465_c0_g1_i1.p1 TRINITY_DN12465_c0_g1~~TRINITY_DN12465_c0_g1_i1.p1  ORF type:complete len:293 (-),score=67.69 TRINITY_DN12465_c0_g1_i1:79-957(-)
MANFVALQNSWENRYLGPVDVISAMISLSILDQITGSAQPSLDVMVYSSKTRLLLASFKITDGQSNVVHSEFFFESIPDPTNITCIAKSHRNTEAGQVTVVLGATFVPAEVSPVSIFRGISVEKVLQLLDPVTHLPVGKNLEFVEREQQVRITIQLVLTDYLTRVTVKDPLAGGLEVLGTMEPQYMPWYFSRWPSYFSREYRPDEVVFSASSVPPGVYTLTYDAVVTIEGRFIVPPTHALVPTNPEINGLSGSFTLCTTTKSMNMKLVPDSATCLPFHNRTLDQDWLKSIPT